MTIQNQMLWEKIKAWDFTPDGSSISFERKLASDNGWTLGFAMLVTEEYRKFLYLTQAAGKLVCPSDEVDQAWHLHLTQTISYGKFCEEVCSTYLHHHASKGGMDELARHKDMYEFTLTKYRESFGNSLNREIWPETENRFSLKKERPTSLSVKRAVILQNVFVAIAVAITVGCVSYMAGVGKVFWTQIDGPSFVKIFFVTMLATMSVAIVFKDRRAPKQKHLALDPYEVAYLEGGMSRAIGTACTQLIGIGALGLRPQVDLNQKQISDAVGYKKMDFDGSQLKDCHFLERTIFESLPDGETKLDNFDTDGKQRLEWFNHETRLRLENAGIAIGRTDITIEKGIAGFLTVGLIAVALNRLAYGYSHYHLVGYLLLEIVACCVMLWYYIHNSVGLTGIGASVMKSLKKEYGSLRTEAGLPKNRTKLNSMKTGSLLALGFALFGTQAVMASTDFAGINFMFKDDDSNNSGNSGGGGGCGGGGCGGGGCGGCGG